MLAFSCDCGFGMYGYVCQALYSFGLFWYGVAGWFVVDASGQSTIDAVRRLIFGDGYSQLTLDFAFVGVFAVIVTAICIVLSWRYLNK